MTLILDGKAIAARLENALAERVGALSRAPVLAVVLVGDNPASKVYVRSKSKRARAIGMEVVDVILPGDVSQSILEAELRALNARPDVDGILLQLPLPKHLDEFSALLTLDTVKDIDGLHPMSQGLLLRGATAHRPCTPLGCLLLARNAVARLRGLIPQDDLTCEQADTGLLKGMHVTIVGRSILVGKPAAHLFLENHCTVTICHSRTRDLPDECRRADIVVAAIGRPKFIGKEFVKDGAIVIDVGINRLDSGELVGDVDFEAVVDRASAITPVPGGVGPMTIAMLLSNTVDAAVKRG